MPRPSRTAPTMVAKLSSVRIIVAASLVTSVPVMPIATPMSALRRAGASLTPSPVIPTTSPRPCSAHDADLVLGGDAGDHADVVEPAGEVGVVGHPVQRRARHRLSRDTEVGGDGSGRDGVVAS